MVACLEWWNSHNIRCSFETGHWTQIPQAFPTLWRMLMSRIQHLRTRLPVHIGFVPVRKPGQETKERNHQSTTQADTQDVNYRNSSANAQQCSNIHNGRPMSFRRPLLPICTLRVGSPSFTTDRWNIRVSQLKTSSREKFLSSHDISTYQLMTSTIHVTSKLLLKTPRKSGIFPHQGAEEPQHSSHASHDSWQSWHSFSTAKSKVQKTSKEFKRLLL